MPHDYLGQAVRPLDAVMPAAAQDASEFLLATILGTALLFGVVRYWRIRDSRILASMAAGFVACLLESHSMTMLKFLYPQVGQHVLYTGFGNPVPVFMGLMYSVFFGSANCLYLIRVRGTMSLRTFTLILGALVCTELALEVVCLHVGLWAYFDDQPFTVGGFPVHVAVIVGAMCLAFGAFSRVWFDRVQGVRQFALIIVGPLFLVAVYSAFAFPVAFALDGDGGLAAARLGALLTIAVSFLGAWSVVRVLSGVSVHRPAPVRAARSAVPGKPAIARGTLMS
jgi:hypothetical protein